MTLGDQTFMVSRSCLSFFLPSSQRVKIAKIHVAGAEKKEEKKKEKKQERKKERRKIKRKKGEKRERREERKKERKRDRKKKRMSQSLKGKRWSSVLLPY